MDSMQIGISLYFLRDPRNLMVRYIGISNDPKYRLTQHWSERLRHYTTGLAKADWFRELDSQGLRPVLDVMITGLTKHQAKRVEHRLVSNWMAKHPGQLLQSPTGIPDNLSEFTKLWDKSSERERLLIERIIAQKSLVSVAS